MNATWPHGDPRDVARAVLADSRYHVAVRSPGPKSLWQLLLDALRSLWDHVFGPLGKLAGNNTLSAIVGSVVLAAAVALLISVVLSFGRRLRRAGPRARAGGATVTLDEDADARTMRARALEALAERRYHDAAALLWSSALHALDERGRVRFDPSRTPGEWRRIVGDPAFDALAGDAVVAFFGERGVDEALVVRMCAAYDRIVPA